MSVRPSTTIFHKHFSKSSKTAGFVPRALEYWTSFRSHVRKSAYPITHKEQHFLWPNVLQTLARWMEDEGGDAKGRMRYTQHLSNTFCPWLLAQFCSTGISIAVEGQVAQKGRGCRFILYQCARRQSFITIDKPWFMVLWTCRSEPVAKWNNHNNSRMPASKRQSQHCE